MNKKKNKKEITKEKKLQKTPTKIKKTKQATNTTQPPPIFFYKVF